MLHRLSIFAALPIAFGFLLMAPTATAENRSVCSFFGIERAMFKAWSAVANQGPAAAQVAGFDYEHLTLQTPDGETLSGYKVAKQEETAANDALIIVQGNATRIESLFALMPALTEGGYDVFAFDYRGYGGSTGVPLLDSIGRDLNQVAQHINTLGYDRITIYGTSMGGIITLGPNMDLTPISAIVIDSSPAHFPWYAFCPEAYQPVTNVPEDTSNILVISNGQERVVSPAAVDKLGKAVKGNGGQHIHIEEFEHPFLDGEDVPRRVELVLKFLTDQK